MSTTTHDLIRTLLASLGTVSKAEQETRRERRRKNDDAQTQTKSTRRSERQNEQDLPKESTNILLTLHVLFPHVLLDALDLLDHGNAIKVSIQCDRDLKSNGPDDNEETADDEQLSKGKGKRSCLVLHHSTYYVLSTRTARGHARRVKDGERSFTSNRPNPNQASKHGKRAEELLEDADKYEVHVAAWNCSCPAFAFAAHSTPIRALGDSCTQDSKSSSPDQDTGEAITEDNAQHAPPICKHLMACLLCDAAPELFGPFEEERAESEDEEAIAEHEATGVGSYDSRNATKRGARQVAVGVLTAAGLAAGV